jgi:hypothetical protein
MSTFSLGLYQFKSIQSKIDELTMAELDFIVGFFLMRLRIDPMFRGLFSRGMGVTWDVFGMVLKEKVLRKDTTKFSFSKTFKRILSSF